LAVLREELRFVRIGSHAGGGAFQAGRAHLFHTGEDLRAAAEFRGVGVFQPEAVAVAAVDEFFATYVGAQPFRRVGLGGEEGGAFGGGEYQVSAVGGLAAFFHLRESGARVGARGEHDVGADYEVGVDVGGAGGERGGAGVVVVVEFFERGVERAEADDDAVDVRFAAGFVVPGEGAVGEMDFDSAFEEVGPEDADLLALRDAVGGDKGAAYRGAADVGGGFAIPGGDVIESSEASVLAPD